MAHDPHEVLDSEARGSEARRLFTERTDSYVRFIRLLRYPMALRAYIWGHIVEARVTQTQRVRRTRAGVAR